MTEDLDININGNAKSALDQLIDVLKEGQDEFRSFSGKATSSLEDIDKRVRKISFVEMYQGMQNVSQGLEDLSAPGMAFNSSMADLQAITGLTGNALDELSDKARNNAKEFGGNAAKSLESYKLLLSQLTPELAKNPAALDAMARNVSLLSKTMGGDNIAATEVLTTAMNQYGVSMEDPIKAAETMTSMMNAMAAAAKEGSAELPIIKQAIENAGGQAKQSGLSFEQLNSAVQMLDKAGKKGAEGGTALRSILVTLSKGRFLPKETREQLEAAGVSVDKLADKNISFTDKMRMLQPVLEKDSALISQLFGEYGQAAASLITSADAQDQMTAAISGTNTAADQAKVVMETHAEKVSRMRAAIEDAKISFFEATGGVTAYLGPINELATTATAFAPVYGALKTSVLAVATAKGRAALATDLLRVKEVAGSVATKVVTAAQWLWNAALTANPIGIVIVAVAALSVAIYGATKALNQQTAAQQLNSEMKSRAIEKSADERAELTILFDKLKSAKKGTDDYTDALKQLDAKYPDIIEKYDLQKGRLEDINRAERELIKSVMMRAEIESANEILREKTKEAQLADTRELTFNESAAKNLNFQSEKEFRRRLKKKAEKEAELAAQQVREIQKKYDAKFGKESTETDTGTESGGTETQTGGLPPVSPNGYSSGSKSPGGERTQGADVKQINVTIQNLGGGITIAAQNVKEGAMQIREILREELIAMVRDLEVSL